MRTVRIMKSAFLLVLLVLSASLACGQNQQFVLGERDVDVGGFTLRVKATPGPNPPTIVIFTALGEPIEGWGAFIPALSEKAMTVIYDRAGLGKSQLAPTPRSSGQVATELHALLVNGGFAPPFVLVGWSLGGNYLREYAIRYPTEVIGMVLVDPRIGYFDEKMMENLPEEYHKMVQDMDAGMNGAPEGVVREWEGAKLDLLKPGSDPLPDVPVVVMSSTIWRGEDIGVPQSTADRMKVLWLESHAMLVRTLSRGAQIIAENTSHSVHSDKPSLFLDSVQKVIDMAFPNRQFPTARFENSPMDGIVPLNVGFDASKSTPAGDSPISSYDWDFGDGGKSQGAKVSHTYSKPGFFPVTLTVNSAKKARNWAQGVIVAKAPSGDIAPWTSVDIGDCKFQGTTRKEGSSITVYAGGSGLEVNTDKLQFAYQELQGDFAITARIEEINDAPGARIGLMVRDSIASKSIRASIGISRSPAGMEVQFSTRSVSKEQGKTQTGGKTTLPAWVKIERKGDTITGYSSKNGKDWEKVGSMNLTAGKEKVVAGIFGLAEEVVPEGAPFTALVGKVRLE